MNTPVLKMTRKEAEAVNRCYALLTVEGPEHGGADVQHYKRLLKVLARVVVRNIYAGKRRNKVEMQRKHKR